MTDTVIKLRRSSVPGSIPTPAQLQVGEVVLNYADDILYFKKSDGTIGSISSGAAGSTALIKQISEEQAVMMAIALG